MSVLLILLWITPSSDWQLTSLLILSSLFDIDFEILLEKLGAGVKYWRIASLCLLLAFFFSLSTSGSEIQKNEFSSLADPNLTWPVFNNKKTIYLK